MRSDEYTVLDSKIHLLELKTNEYCNKYMTNSDFHSLLQNMLQQILKARQ
jgi:hypothetical protein